VPLPHGEAPGVLAGGRLTGRWRYNRVAGRGIALSYDRSANVPPALRGPDVHAGGRFTGRWRYNRVAGRGIALSYDESAAARPAPPAADPEPKSPVPTHSPVVRVLCSCGDEFTFEGEAGICPGCGRAAEWPTMGVVEREMRSDLAELLRVHERRADPD
jgi:hypothetical protein